jgi:beta-N-acetylhexosaminidase
VDVDPHHRLGVVESSTELLETRELVPFRAALAAGARMVMSAHVALPAITHDRAMPATVSRQVMSGLLRGRLGFSGVSITDAMDMKAVAQGSAGIVDALVALRAGVDLLLLTPDRAAQRRLESGLRQAALRRLLPAAGIRASRGRILALRRWLARAETPGPEVVRCEAHRRLARRAAGAAITLVRDGPGLLPLRLAAGARLVVITPQPRELTPADSSNDEPLALAEALRRHHDTVVDVRVAAEPDDREIAAAREAAAGGSAVIVVTLAADAQPAQARLVEAILSTGTPTVTVAMRTPWDLGSYPGSGTHICAYAIVPASVGAVADAIVGKQPIGGHLPVDLPGLYPRGHGMEVERWA